MPVYSPTFQWVLIVPTMEGWLTVCRSGFLVLCWGGVPVLRQSPICVYLNDSAVESKLESLSADRRIITVSWLVSSSTQIRYRKTARINCVPESKRQLCAFFKTFGKSRLKILKIVMQFSRHICMLGK